MARLFLMLNLLEEADRLDKIRKRRLRRIRILDIYKTDAYYLRSYGLTKGLVDQLENDLINLMPEPIRQGGLSHRSKILCTLSFLTTGSYENTVRRSSFNYVSQRSASRAICAVVNALIHPEILKKYIKFPQNRNEREELKQRFYDTFKIPGVIGCVDGTLVTMIRPKEQEERFYCRNGIHARNVLIFSDSDLNILHVDATFGGATDENHIFNSSVIQRHLEELQNMGEEVCLLADSAYEQRSYMMTPCTDPEAGSPEEYYNSLHSNAWNTVEKTIRILKSRFRCLHKVLHYDPLMVCKIIIACCVLHNLCNSAGLPIPELPNDMQEEGNDFESHDEIEPDAISALELEHGLNCRRELVDTLWWERQL